MTWNFHGIPLIWLGILNLLDNVHLGVRLGPKTFKICQKSYFFILVLWVNFQKLIKSEAYYWVDWTAPCWQCLILSNLSSIPWYIRAFCYFLVNFDNFAHKFCKILIHICIKILSQQQFYFISETILNFRTSFRFSQMHLST